MDKVLYFPYINLPTDSWTIRTVLYWDKVGSIVPQSYGQRDNFSNFTEDLINQGLVERINPYDVWQVPNYEASLSKAIMNDQKLLESSRINFMNGHFKKIHREKFHYEVFEKIVELEVAQKVNYSDWFIVEDNVAKLMMTFLASVLSIEKNLQPTTNDAANLDFSFTQTENRKFLSELKKESDILTNVRGEILEEIMPYPIDLDLYNLNRFKERHYEKLRTFRKHIERTIFNISLIADPDNRKIAIKREILEINDQKEELLKKMKEFNFKKIFFGGACGLLASASPLVVEPSLFAIPALMYGLYTVYKDTKRDKIENPFHYLALTDRQFLPR